MDFEQYKNHDPYPDRPKKPFLSNKPTPAEARKYANDLEKYEVEIKEFHKKRTDWNNKQYILEEKFREDVLKEHGIYEHPKANKLYSIAWDQGHSSGLGSVAYWVGELADLIKE